MDLLKQMLDNLEHAQDNLDAAVSNKFKNGGYLEDNEIDAYSLNEDEEKLLHAFKRVLDGDKVPGFSLKDFVATPQAKVLIPRVIIGTARKAADPIYLASKFFKKVRLNSGQAIKFPSFGVMRAYDVGEGQEVPEHALDWQLHENGLIGVGKVGLRVAYTDEVVKDTEFDIVGMMISEAGRALARHKEQKAFKEWQKHSYVVFDNKLAASNPTLYGAAATTGVDFENIANGTMSIDDYLDIIIALYNNGYTPTDIIMHALAFPAFVKAGLTGSLSAYRDRDAKGEPVNASFKIGPEAIAGKLPFGLTVNLSPFAPIDKTNKTFDLYAVDRDNVGVLIVKDEIKTENFREPARDLNNVKMVERYGFGIHDQGRAVCSARNISLAKSYPTPERVYNITTV